MTAHAEASPPTHARVGEVRDLAAVEGYRPPAELIPHPKNPRDHDEGENLRRAREIVRTTWGAPILVQASTGMIIDGCGRRESALLILAGIEVDGVMRGGASWARSSWRRSTWPSRSNASR